MHIVGGGARNGLLCQLTADACGLPVPAGPVDATALRDVLVEVIALGDVLVRARAAAALGGDLLALRGQLRETHRIVRYEPRGAAAAWRAVERRLEA